MHLMDAEVLQYRAKRLAGKNVPEITYFVSGGTEKTST